MATNFFEQFMNAQQDMMSSWADLMNPMYQPANEEKGEDVEDKEKKAVDFSDLNPFKFMEDPKKFFENYNNAVSGFMENSMKFTPFFPFDEEQMKELMENNPFKDQQELYWKNLMALNQLFMQQGFNDPRELWKKYSESMGNFMSTYKLFQLFEGVKDGKIENVEEIIDQWMAAYNDYLHTYFIPMLPADLQDPMKKSIDLYDSYYKARKNIVKPYMAQWADILSEPKALYQSGLGGYFNALEDLQKSGLNFFQDYLDSPLMPIDEDMVEVQKKMVDRMEKYGQSLMNYYKNLGEIVDNSTKDATDNFFKLMSEGVEPKTFEEFFEFWNERRHAFLQSAFKSPEFEKIKEETKQAMKDYQKDNEELLREYFSFLKIPKLRDVDELSNQVNDMQEIMQEMNKEIQEIRKSIEK